MSDGWMETGLFCVLCSTSSPLSNHTSCAAEYYLTSCSGSQGWVRIREPFSYPGCHASNRRQSLACSWRLLLTSDSGGGIGPGDPSTLTQTHTIWFFFPLSFFLSFLFFLFCSPFSGLIPLFPGCLQYPHKLSSNAFRYKNLSQKGLLPCRKT